MMNILKKEQLNHIFLNTHIYQSLKYKKRKKIYTQQQDNTSTFLAIPFSYFAS